MQNITCRTEIAFIPLEIQNKAGDVLIYKLMIPYSPKRFVSNDIWENPRASRLLGSNSNGFLVI